MLSLLQGHCDVLMGALCTNDEEMAKKLTFLQLSRKIFWCSLAPHILSLSLCSLSLPLSPPSLPLPSLSSLSSPPSLPPLFLPSLPPSLYLLLISLSLCLSGVGAIPSPFDCYLANRGIRTLHVRMKQHQSNAFEVARFLEKSPYVEEVRYPG